MGHYRECNIYWLNMILWFYIVQCSENQINSPNEIHEHYQISSQNVFHIKNVHIQAQIKAFLLNI